MPTLDTPLAGAPIPYDRVQRALHWSMALLIIAAMLIGLFCAYQVPGTPLRRFLLEWHKSFGLTALALFAVRAAYRLAAGAPPHAGPHGRAERLAAAGGHLALYALMLLVPLTGYAFSAMDGYSLPFYGLFQWPRVLPVDKAGARAAEALHLYGAWAIYAMVGLHLAAVAWHRFVRRDGVLARMWPRRPAKRRAAAARG